VAARGNVGFHDDRFCSLAAVFASLSYDFSAGVPDFTLVFPQLVACKAGSGWQMSFVGERAAHKVKVMPQQIMIDDEPRKSVLEIHPREIN